MWKKQKNMTITCPNCQKLSTNKYRPFCSSRCLELDLARWLNEDYRVPIIEKDEFVDDDNLL